VCDLICDAAVREAAIRVKSSVWWTYDWKQKKYGNQTILLT